MRTQTDERRRLNRVEVLGLEVGCEGGNLDGMYQVSDLSFHGALLCGGPVATLGSQIHLDLEFDNRPPAQVTAHAVRHQTSTFGQRMFAVEFETPTQEALLHIGHAILCQWERPRVSAVLVAGSYGWPAKNLLSDLHAIERQAIAAQTPKRALALLAEEQLNIGTVIIEAGRPDFDALELSRLVAEYHPGVRRVLLQGPVPTDFSMSACAFGLVDAVLEQGWNYQLLRDALAEPTQPAELRLAS